MGVVAVGRGASDYVKPDHPTIGGEGRGWVHEFSTLRMYMYRYIDTERHLLDSRF